jgi:hypothetical protein
VLMTVLCQKKSFVDGLDTNAVRFIVVNQIWTRFLSRKSSRGKEFS